MVANIALNDTADAWNIELRTYFSNSSGQSSVQGKLSVELITDITQITNIFDVNLIETQNDEFISITNISVPKVWHVIMFLYVAKLLLIFYVINLAECESLVAKWIWKTEFVHTKG